MLVPLFLILALGTYLVYLEYWEVSGGSKSRRSAQVSSSEPPIANRMTNASSKSGSRAKIDADLLSAATWGHTSTLVGLVNAGANINAKATNGDTALLLAATQGNAETVVAALALGADVNAKNNAGNTALMEAVESGRIEMVKVIIARNPDVNAKNVAGSSAFDLARTKGRRDLLQVLRGRTSTAVSHSLNSPQRGVTYAGLHQAALEGNAKGITSLLATGADVNARDANGRTALMIAASAGKTDVVELLLVKGANPNMADYKEGRTALIVAAEAGHAEAARSLLNKGADPNVKDRFGETAMSNAQRLKRVHIGRLLKQAGVKTPSFEQILPKQ